MPTPQKPTRLQEKLQTHARRVLKQAAFKVRKWAKFNAPHTGQQPNNPPIIAYRTRKRQVAKTSWQVKKWLRNGFTKWHVFTAPPPPQSQGGTGFIRHWLPITTNLAHHVRSIRQEIKRKATWQARKLARFTQWHTGTLPTSVPVIQNIQFKTRVRRFVKRASWQLRKLTVYPLLNTGKDSPRVPSIQARRVKAQKPSWQLRKWAHYTLFKLGMGGYGAGQQTQPFVVQNIGFKTRVRSVLHSVSKLKRLARFGQIFHTGTSFSAEPQSFRSPVRRGKVQKKSGFNLRKLARFQLFHTGIEQSHGPSFKTRKAPVLKHGSIQSRKKAKYLLFNTGLSLPTSRQIAGFSSRRRAVLRVRHNKAQGYTLSLFHVPTPTSIGRNKVGFGGHNVGVANVHGGVNQFNE